MYVPINNMQSFFMFQKLLFELRLLKRMKARTVLLLYIVTSTTHTRTYIQLHM